MDRREETEAQEEERERKKTKEKAYNAVGGRLRDVAEKADVAFYARNDASGYSPITSLRQATHNQQNTQNRQRRASLQCDSRGIPKETACKGPP